MAKEGFIFLHRKIEDWEWYDDANTFRLFIHCLLEANFTEKNWRGIKIERGQFITSQPKLAHSLKLSIMQIRTSLNKLKSTGEITVLTTADYSIITIKNYDEYQQNNSLNNGLITDKQQSNNSLITTTNNDNNDNNDNNEKKYTHTTSEEMQANDKLASIEFIHTKDYQFIKAVYQQVYGLKLARLSSEQLSVVRSWFEIVDNPTKIQLVLDYYKNEYTWDGGKKPSANWIFKSSTNFINVYDDMVQKRGSTFSMLKEG